MLHLFTIVSFVLGLASASIVPTFTETDGKTLKVVFPLGSSPVNRVIFTYRFNSEKNEYHTVSLTKNPLGYFTYTFNKEEGVLEYTVTYESGTKNLFISHGTYESKDPVVPQHHIVRRGTVVLHDTFDSNHLDMGKWKYEVTCWGGGNNEFQMYTPEAQNTYIKNGDLYMRPTFTADKFGESFLHNGNLDVQRTWGSCTSNNEGGCHRSGNQIPPIMSSKIVSKASITHGRVEVVAKLPVGDWLWPAIWMLPPGWPWKYGGWPASGEIDIMEARGNRDLKDYQGNDQGINVIYSTIHWGPSPGQHRQAGHWRKTGSGTWGDGFHTYSLDWTTDHIRMDVDGQPAFIMNTPPQGYWGYSHFGGNNIWAHGGHDAPFDSKFSLIMNVAVGGNFFDDHWTNKGHPKPWHQNSGNQAMDFWNNRHQWQSTWHGEDVAMKVRSVKMIQY